MREKSLIHSDLVKLVRTLRRKCPWDKKQTLKSLKNNLLEESYELIEAIEKGEINAIAEEIGDVIFLGIFFAVIFEQEKKVSLQRLFKNTVRKYRDKHPHVFGAKELRNTDEVLRYWQSRKLDIFHGIPAKLPALLAAKLIQERAAKSGFDWPTRKGPVKKVREELREIQGARSKAGKLNELGDLLFSCVNLARHLRVDPEDALRSANRKFVHRFRRMKKRLEQAGRKLDEASLSEMDRIWDQIKAG